MYVIWLKWPFSGTFGNEKVSQQGAASALTFHPDTQAGRLLLGDTHVLFSISRKIGFESDASIKATQMHPCHCFKNLCVEITESFQKDTALYRYWMMGL